MMTQKFIASIFLFVLIFIIPTTASAEGKSKAQIAAERAKLKAQIVQQEMEIQQERIKLLKKKKERKGYEQAAAVLNSQVRKADLTIRKRELAIKSISYDITDKSKVITKLDKKINREEESLGQLLRKKREHDDVSFIELIFAGKTFSDAFADVDRFDTIKEALTVSFQEIARAQNTLRTEQEKLAEARGDQEELKMIQEQERKEVAARKRKKDQLANQVRKKERVSEKAIKVKERSVAQIRSQLFALRDSNRGSLSFGTMLKYAREAGKRTDVNPALILGIMTVETNLGKDLGVGKWNEDMHPTRDVPIFKEIVAELGLDPDKMPISARPCSAAKRRAAGAGNRCGYGYGGAMGPAQFIPSTWKLFKKRIARLSGQNPPNPWDPRTAVFATALLMMDNGADKGTRTSEHKAAVRYLAGWRNAEKSEYWWYGDKTMRFRDQYMRDIKALDN